MLDRDPTTKPDPASVRDFHQQNTAESAMKGRTCLGAKSAGDVVVDSGSRGVGRPSTCPLCGTRDGTRRGRAITTSNTPYFRTWAREYYHHAGRTIFVKPTAEKPAEVAEPAPIDWVSLGSAGWKSPQASGQHPPLCPATLQAELRLWPAVTACVSHSQRPAAKRACTGSLQSDHHVQSVQAGGELRPALSCVR